MSQKTRKKKATRAGRTPKAPAPGSTAASNEKAFTFRAWAGFVAGAPDCGWRLGNRDDITPIYSVFRTRAAARRAFADVRLVEFRVIQ